MRFTERNNKTYILVNFLRVLTCILFLSLVTVVNATTIEEIPKPKLSNVLGTVYTEEQIAELVDIYATKYGVDRNKMISTIECESHYKNVQSGLYHRDGTREDSWGLAQIHLPNHPNVTREQALDPYFAIEFMAEKFSKGWYKWSCYK